MHRPQLARQTVDAEIAPMQDAAREGRLLIKRCDDCGEPYWHPRALCPFCMSANTSWVEAAGSGTIYTYSIMRRSPTGPYALAYVKLAEGPMMMTQIVDCTPSEVAIGKPVRVVFQEVEGGAPLPLFALSD